MQSTGYSIKQKILSLSGNAELREWQAEIPHNPSILKKPEHLVGLSGCLASQGFVREGIELANLALKKSGSKRALRLNAQLNLSVMYGQIDDREEQLKALNAVPDGTKGKAIIYANLLIDTNRSDAATPFLEQAIREEPKFYLPYARLIRILGKGEAALYWSDLAVQKFKTDPEIAFHFAYTNFLHQNYNRIDEIIGNNSIYDLSSDSRTIGGRANKSDFLHDTKLIIEISRALVSESTSDLPAVVDDMSRFQFGSKCELVMALLPLIASYGDIEVAHSACEMLCDTCSKNLDKKHFLFKTAICGEQLEDAKALAKERLNDHSLNSSVNFIIDYCSFLDDIGRASESLELMEPYLNKTDIHFTTSARMIWDSQFYSSQVGNWLLCLKLIEMFLEIDQNDLKNFGGVNTDGAVLTPFYFEPFLHWAVPNKLFYLLSLRRFDEYTEERDSYIAKLESTSQHSETEEIALAQLNELYNWALEEAPHEFHNSFYINSVAIAPSFEKLKGKMSKSSTQGKPSSSFDAFFSGNLPIKNESCAKIYLQMMEESGDYSIAVNSLCERLNTFRTFPQESKHSLIESEFRYLNNRNHFDYSPTLIGYCKGLEIFMHKQIFSPFRNQLRDNEAFATILETAKTDKKYTSFSAIVTFLKSERIELGAMERVFTLCLGKTSERVELLRLFKGFLVSHYPATLDEGFLQSLSTLVSGYRNPAVHAKRFEKEDLEEVRKIVISMLSSLSDVRVVSDL